MLIRMLKSLTRAGAGTPEPARAETPVEIVARMERAYASAPLDDHIRIAYGGMKVGEHDLMDLVRRSLADSNSSIPPRKQLHRPLSSFFLAQYFLHALEVEGDKAECGVFSGTSALIACRAAQTRRPGYTGAGLHLIDSFEGLADPTEADRFTGRESADSRPYVKGAYAAPMEVARTTLRDFPQVAYHKGWIPAVLATLPESKWSFVHLDVDHYEPTYGALAYFYPRLSTGGVIICDDYGSPTFPGAMRAWHDYSDEHSLPFVVLDTGQSVILKTR